MFDPVEPAQAILQETLENERENSGRKISNP
jgi:hypothetical protein